MEEGWKVKVLKAQKQDRAERWRVKAWLTQVTEKFLMAGTQNLKNSIEKWDGEVSRSDY